MENLMAIGDFARAAQLSQKALRLYDKRGVLRPAWVDPDTGYRYYGVEQIRPAILIQLLRRAGIPLAEIDAFLRAPSVDALGRYEGEAAAEFVERRQVLRYVKRLLEEDPMFEVETKHVPAQRYAARSAHITVGELERFIEGALRELRTQHEAAGPPFTLFHGRVDEEANGPVDVCLPAPTGDRELPAGEVAFTVVTGSECRFPQILGAYDAVACWTRERDREFDGPCREIYLTDEREGAVARMEIAFPLR